MIGLSHTRIADIDLGSLFLGFGALVSAFAAWRAARKGNRQMQLQNTDETPGWMLQSAHERAQVIAAELANHQADLKHRLDVIEDRQKDILHLIERQAKAREGVLNLMRKQVKPKEER